MKNHYRPDYSSYHVVDYDTMTGKVVKKNTTRVMHMNRHGAVDRHGVCMVILCAIGLPKT